MAEQRNKTIGAEIGYVLANLAAMQPFAKKRRITAEDFNPYSKKQRVAFKTKDVRYLYAAFGVWPDKEGVKHNGRGRT